MTPARCADCHAKLSRYREPGETRCWQCAPAYTEPADTTPRRDGYCKYGHELATHGVIVRTEGDRHSRKCGKCRTIRAIEYQSRRRARLRAIRAGATATLEPTVADQARAQYEADTRDMLALRAQGVTATEIARRIGAKPETIRTRIWRAQRKATA